MSEETCGGGQQTQKCEECEKEQRLRALNKLPIEKKEAVQKAIEEFIQKSWLSIEEPCNCGSHIQHNTGGNYHTWYDITVDEGKYYIKEGTTNKFSSPYKWKESTKEEVYQLIQNCADWLG